MSDPNLKEIKRLLDLIHTCDVAVLRLRHDPPETMSFMDIEDYKSKFNQVGAKALVDYYRLTAPLFEGSEAA